MRDEGQSPAEAVLDLKPEFVMVRGQFKLLSERIAERWLRDFARGLQPIQVAHRDRCRIDAAIADLHLEATKAIGPQLHMAGRFVNVECAA